MHRPQPVMVILILQEERARLITLLRGIRDEQWGWPTACPGWSVKDIALHLAGTDLGRLSWTRDGIDDGPADPRSLLEWLNQRNQQWVEATRRLSPAVICDLLRVGGQWSYEYFASLDPFALGVPVTWAGPDAAPVWLDIARDYTERWTHQQQIREAIGVPLLTAPELFAPVLATFVRALPFSYRDVDAPAGTALHLQITGEAGSNWALVRENGEWVLYSGTPERPAARVTIDQDVTWRLFTKGLTPEQAVARAAIAGDRQLAERALRTVSIIA